MRGPRFPLHPPHRSLSPARSSSLTRRFAMHTRVRDVVPRPTRPHGHCQLGVTRIICAIILDNRRHRLVVNEENLHTMPLVTVYMVSPAPLFPSQGRRTNAYLTGRCKGGQGESRRKEMRNYRKGHRSPRLLLTTSMYPRTHVALSISIVFTVG